MRLSCCFYAKLRACAGPAPSKCEDYARATQTASAATFSFRNDISEKISTLGLLQDSYESRVYIVKSSSVRLCGKSMKIMGLWSTESAHSAVHDSHAGCSGNSRALGLGSKRQSTVEP